GRRHTSFSRDWSSDVCSSDLAVDPQHVLLRAVQAHQLAGEQQLAVALVQVQPEAQLGDLVRARGGEVPFDAEVAEQGGRRAEGEDRKSTRLNSSHVKISYAVF